MFNKLQGVFVLTHISQLFQHLLTLLDFFLSTPNSPYRCCCDFLVQILRSQHGYLIIFSDTFCFSSVHLRIYFLEPQPIAGQTQRDRQFCVTNHPNMYAFRLWEEAGSFEPTCRVLVLLFHPPNWQSHWLYTHIKCVLLTSLAIHNNDIIKQWSIPNRRPANLANGGETPLSTDAVKLNGTFCKALF